MEKGILAEPPPPPRASFETTDIKPFIIKCKFILTSAQKSLMLPVTFT